MNVLLTPELERWVQDKVETGLYENVSEVVREALRKMLETEEAEFGSLAEVRAAVAEADADIAAGRFAPLTSNLTNEIVKRAKARKG